MKDKRYLEIRAKDRKYYTQNWRENDRGRPRTRWINQINERGKLRRNKRKQEVGE